MLPDPRVGEIGVTVEDLQAQHTFQQEVMLLLSAARKLEDKLEKKLKAPQKGSDDAVDKITAALTALQTEEGIYMQPMLLDQISYLYYMVIRGDQRPGNDAYVRLKELKDQYANLEGSID